MNVRLTIYKEFMDQTGVECIKIADSLGRKTAVENPTVFPLYPSSVFTKVQMSNRLPVAVILGQDPYPQAGVATGIAFANHQRIGRYAGVPLSPSLQVIKKSVQTAFPGAFDETMEHWINQGILLFNSAFTVEKDKPGSHSIPWAAFTAKLLRQLSTMFPDLYYILFGKTADFFAGHIMSGKIIHEMHPSYYARTNKELSPKIWKDMVGYVQDKFNTKLYLTV